MPLDTNWMENYRKECAANVAKVNKGKAVLLAMIPSLKAAGAAVVVVHYDGSGDEGQIESVTAYSDGKLETAVPLADGDEKAIEDAAYDVLGGQDFDWVNNDGGFGDVILAVKTGNISIQHNARFSDSHYSEHKV